MHHASHIRARVKSCWLFKRTWQSEAIIAEKRAALVGFCDLDPKGDVQKWVVPKSSQIRPLCYWNLWFWGPSFQNPPNLGRSHKKWTAAALIPHMFRPPNVSAAHLVLPDILKARYLILYIYNIQYTMYIYINIAHVLHLVYVMPFFQHSGKSSLVLHQGLGSLWPSLYSHNRQRQMWIYIYI